MVRILNAEPVNYDAAARAVLASCGELVELELSQVELTEQVRNFDVLIVRLGLQVDERVIDADTRLRVIVSATTGMDHIDLEYRGMK